MAVARKVNDDSVGIIAENSQVIEQKRVEVTQKLQQREIERQAIQQQRNFIRNEKNPENESADYFNQKFEAGKQEIEEQMKNIDSLDKGDLLFQFDEISKSLQKLQKYVTESTMFITSYEIQKTQESISGLTAALSQKREILLPKKKFAFKGKKKNESTAVPVVKKEDKKKIDIELPECHFVDENRKVLSKESNEVNNKDVALSRLKDCEVKLFGTPGTVHINNLENCKVLTGPVSRSVFIDKCINCTFVMACQQMRIHNTSACSFYIHVTSKAIIEDCHDVTFAPFNWTYKTIEEDYKQSGLQHSKNNWNAVDDFNWLASDVPSPNWSIIDPGQRVEKWT